jgi:hypothetical protein
VGSFQKYVPGLKDDAHTTLAQPFLELITGVKDRFAM